MGDGTGCNPWMPAYKVARQLCSCAVLSESRLYALWKSYLKQVMVVDDKYECVTD